MISVLTRIHESALPYEASWVESIQANCTEISELFIWLDGPKPVEWYGDGSKLKVLGVPITVCCSLERGYIYGIEAFFHNRSGLVAVLDFDDCWLPGHLAVALEKLCMPSKFEFYCCSPIYVNERGDRINTGKTFSTMDAACVARHSPIPFSSFVWNAAYSPPNLDHKRLIDNGIAINAFKKGRAFFSPHPTVKIRKTHTSDSANKFVQFKERVSFFLVTLEFNILLSIFFAGVKYIHIYSDRVKRRFISN